MIDLQSKPVRITVTVVSFLLALMFMAAGVPKLLGSPDVTQGFATYGFPGWFPFVVGVIEVISAVLLVVPRLSFVGAIGIAVVMLGAAYTHLFLATNEAPRAAFTIVLAALALFIAYARSRRAQAAVART